MNHTQLHITNGDGAAALIKASRVDGDVLPWRDTMHDGPFPKDLDLDAVSEVRARYLAGPGLPHADISRDFTLRNDHLKAVDKYDEIVLWFEHDLLDQLQILQILDYFASVKFEISKLKLICINQFEGIENFRGLGQLNPDQLSELYLRRTSIARDQLNLAKLAWSAFRSDDPRDLQAVISEDLSALPFLKPALKRHLQEYPWKSDGLTRSERQILQLVSAGHSKPGELFHAFMDLEDVFFQGDWWTFSIVSNLADAKVPLIKTKSGESFRHPREFEMGDANFAQQELKLTETAENLLHLKENAFAYIERDHYLGGVNINSNHSMWVWNEDEQSVELLDV